MERIEIDYLELEREVIHFISQNTTWVLATAAGNHVTARSIFTVSNGLIIFFQTDKIFLKYKQIMMNSDIALCRDNFQIEGKAREIGHPLDAKNLVYSDLFRQHHPLAYKRYSTIKTETLFEIRPTQITIWKHTDKQSYRDMLMIVSKKAYRENYVTHSH
jgi:hypothetical protein